MNVIKSHLLLAFAAFAVVAQEPARADLFEQPRSRLVRFQDVNLDSRAGLDVLQSRLFAAAKSVCGPTETRDLRNAARYRKCVARSFEDAVATIDDPRLTAHVKGTTDNAIRTAASQ